MSSNGKPNIGCVIIGRNEGERLRRCLNSLVGRVSALVYVDSNSTDDSVAFARSMGVEVLELDLSVPFTAARARNAGFECLSRVAPGTTLVQFVDGDCEVEAGWIESAAEILANRPELAAVCGVRRERYPDKTVFNRLCDIEWRSGAYGEVDKFGGDVMIRAEVVRAVGGYNPNVIAAEDDEFALRVRLAGHRILRIERPMTVHDAAMERVGQWWQRAKRCGHGYAQVGAMHGRTPFHKFAEERRSVLFWGALLPTLSFALTPVTLGTSLGLFSVYPLQAVRIARNSRREGMSLRDAAAWGVSCAFSKFPEALGMLRYHVRKARKRGPQIIEYKGPARA